MTVQWTLWLSAILALVAAGLYIYLGRRLWQRNIALSEARLAWRLFSVWWFCLGATSLSSALLNLGGALGVTNIGVFTALTYVNILFICVALWGLLYYLLYLFTANTHSLYPLGGFYVFFYGLLVYFIIVSEPNRVEVSRWGVRLGYQSQPTGAFSLIVIVALLFPQIFGSLAYLSLLFRVRESTQRYRITIVSLSILLWFGSAFIASIGGLSQHDWWQIASRLIGLGAATAILLAYLPPGWVRRRFHIRSIEDNVAGE